MAGEISIELEGKSYSLDDFDLGDLEWLEEYVGKPLADGETLNSMKCAVGLVFIIKRQDNPAYTLEEARRTKLKVFGPGDEEPEPKKRPTKAAPAS